MDYLEDVVNDFHREDYYLAQIAAEIRRGVVKEPERVRVQDLLLHFSSSDDEKKVTSPLVKEQESVNFWFGLVGMENEED